MKYGFKTVLFNIIDNLNLLTCFYKVLLCLIVSRHAVSDLLSFTRCFCFVNLKYMKEIMNGMKQSVCYD